ncbi:DoxX family protein [Saccharopolyspora griseoalba]|uniref:DoxX family protein n=1 Tax=Saccharopolyspora griseoalba TaxID=1431848 RepID=A0ABW2LM17_9PSEU
MSSAYVVITALAVAANGASGIVGPFARERTAPAMRRVGVPESWVLFPISTLKLAGALGLLLGLLGVPLVGLAAAVGLCMFWACAVHTHLLARDRSPQLGLALGFLALALASLALTLAG